MTRALKVYGWSSFRSEASGTHRQTREIAAAKSASEVARLAGVKRPSQLFCLCETRNSFEVETALRDPGRIFWREINKTGVEPFILSQNFEEDPT